MNEVAQLTYNQYVLPYISRPECISSHLRGDFVEVMEMMDKRLNDKGKNWRHVFKVGLRQRAGTDDRLLPSWTTAFTQVQRMS